MEDETKVSFVERGIVVLKLTMLKEREERES